MAIKLIDLKNVDLSDGFKMDVMGMLIAETETGAIEWKAEKLAYTYYVAQLSDALKVEVTPFDYNYSNKSIKLIQKKDGEHIILTMDKTTPDFETRIAEIEKAIFNQLYGKEFFDVFKNVHGKKDLLKIKAYPNDQKMPKDNLPIIKERKQMKTDSSINRRELPKLKVMTSVESKREVPHMQNAVTEAAVRRGIEKIAKRFGKRKHCKISIKDITIEVWSDPVTK